MNTSLTALTESIVENGKTVLAATLVKKGLGEMYHRIVLRWVDDEYVVHIETLHQATVRFPGDPGSDDQTCFVHAGYTDGFYTKEFDKALGEFSRRARHHLDKMRPLHARLGT